MRGGTVGCHALHSNNISIVNLKFAPLVKAGVCQVQFLPSPVSRPRGKVSRVSPEQSVQGDQLRERRCVRR